ncbi:hypothetical protein ACEWY4_013032 [Coilia grayii]|uniref:Uncharacterized protein n=1 Tax=Coilia grayii TaxID=363190 RepID=A0ABD1JV90_9TELE
MFNISVCFKHRVCSSISYHAQLHSGFPLLDLSKISESLSLSDLNMGFCVHPSSSVSALEMSASTIHFPKEILVEFSNINTSSTINPDLLPPSPIVVSPSLAPQQSPLVLPTHTLKLPLTLQGKSAALLEQELLKTPILTSSPNLSSLNLSATNWEVSQIRPASVGHKIELESTELELTWSPRNQLDSRITSVVAEVSSLVCSATPPPVASLSDGQRSWKETLPLECVQEGTESLE